MSKQTDLINIPDAITVDGTKVGIGTTSPTLPLDIVSNAAADALKIRARPTSDDYGTLTFYNNAGTTKWADIQSNVAKDLRFYTNGGTERMRILSGGGITFNGDTAAANALNDYEEGTWTPTHTGGSGTGSFSDARYTKIGNTVHIYFAFSFSSGGGSMAISGFPFNCNGNTVGIGREDQTNGYGVYGRINAGDSTVYIYATQASSNASAYQVSSGAIKFAMTYETNS
jgi:hypothetical protein